ncbi:MAG: cyclic nucleotide-binding domain-containing protein [Deltaproteobacteria bacterium]|nr:cyclic nucleotide-binding domain-containing protein [Deltaproteobacteria bacterium]
MTDPTNRKRSRPRAPTTALDQSVAALAQNDPDLCLRIAIPVLDDVGAGAPAIDIIGRAAVSVGAMGLARLAFETAARALALQGLAAHAVAAAIAVQRLSSKSDLLTELAGVFGADAERESNNVSVLPPPLASERVTELGDVPRAELIALATKKIEALKAALPAKLPARARLPLWGALPRGAFERLAKAMEVRVFAPSHAAILEGERGGSVFVVARGEVRIARKVAASEAGAEEGDEPEELAVLGAEAVFGEMALLTEAPRAASVHTTRASIVLEAPPPALALAVKEVPSLGAELRAFSQQRLVQNLLRTAPLLREIPLGDREALAGAFEAREFAEGEVLFAQGSEASGLFLVASGRLEVRRCEDDGSELVIGGIDPGGCVGEISLVLRRPTNATVIAVEPTVALVLAPENFMGIVRQHPALLSSLYELAVSREEELIQVTAQAAEDADDLVMV